MRKLMISAALLVVVRATAGAAPPAIFHISPGNEAVPLLVVGDGLVPNETEIIYWCPEPFYDLARGQDWHAGAHPEAEKQAEAELVAYLGKNPPLPATPPEKSKKYRFNPWTGKATACGPRGLAGQFRTRFWIGSGDNCLSGNNARVVWLRTRQGLSRPYLYDAPQAWWIDRDEAAAGDRVRVYGRSLNIHTFPPFRLVYLRSQSDGRLYKAEWGSPTNIGNIYSGDLDWEVRFKVPKCPAGQYEVFIHQGSGGRYGWSAPLPLNVVAPDKDGGPTVQATAFGARGDGQNDDSRALGEAVESLTKTGGVLYLPAGKYLLSQPLVIPPRVRLRGCSPGGTWLIADNGRKPVVRATGQCAVEDLTLAQGQPGPAPLLVVGDGATVARDVRIEGIRFRAEPGPMDPAAPGDNQALVIASPAYGLEVRNCDLADRRMICALGGLERSYIGYNTGGVYVQGYMRRCVIEYNECRGGGGFIFKATSGDVAHNYLTWNRLGDAGQTPVGGGYLFHAVSPVAQAVRVATSSHDGFTADKPLSSPGGQYCALVAGSGRGQVRRVVKVTGPRVVVEPAWDRAPEPGSLVYLGPMVFQNIVVNNFHVRSASAFSLVGACVENFLARLAPVETWGIRTIGVRSGGVAYPCYYNVWDQVNMYGGGSIGFAGQSDSRQPEAVLLMGNQARGSRVYRCASSSPVPSYLPSASDGPAQAGAFWLASLFWDGKAWLADPPSTGIGLLPVGEANFLNGCQVTSPEGPAGVRIGRGFDHTFHACVFTTTTAGLEDQGRRTTAVK